MPEGRSRGYAGNLLDEAHTAILMREHGIRRTRFAADNIRSDVGVARDPFRLRFLLQERDQRGRIDDHCGGPLSS